MIRKRRSYRQSRPNLRRSAWVFVGLLATGLVAASCRATGTPSGEMDRYRGGLEGTTGKKSSDEKVLATGMAGFVDLFSDFRPDSVHSSALALYADDAQFDDGFAVLEGNLAVADYLYRSAKHVDGLDVVIADTVIQKGEVYVRWQMRFAGSGKGVVTDVPGISHLRFDSDARIIYHRDYWDASGALADRLPAVGGLLRWVRGRI